MNTKDRKGLIVIGGLILLIVALFALVGVVDAGGGTLFHKHLPDGRCMEQTFKHYPPPGQGWQPGPCHCDAGEHLDDDGRCVEDPLVCPDGTHEEDGACVEDPLVCPDGTHEEDGACVPDVIPPKPATPATIAPELPGWPGMRVVCAISEVGPGPSYLLFQGHKVTNQAGAWLPAPTQWGWMWNEAVGQNLLTPYACWPMPAGTDNPDDYRAVDANGAPTGVWVQVDNPETGFWTINLGLPWLRSQ